ncbi:MAG TPA: hypothetical protein PLC43_03775 [Caldisericia bacterium]|nr:hypothetical protein [Caldisericia bacterium]
MLNLLRIGYIVPFIVLKNYSEEAILVKLLGQSEVIAILPRSAMIRNYKIGDTGFGCITMIDRARILLSQKSPLYVRKMLEYLLADAIIGNKLKIKKIAGMRKSRFYKVAIGSVYDVNPKKAEVVLNNGESINNDTVEFFADEDDPVAENEVIPEQYIIKSNEELFERLKPVLKDIDFKEYFEENTKFSFVRFSYDKKEYVLNALCPPGKRESIYKVIYYSEMNRVSLLMENSSVGFLKGKNGENIAIATKLCDVEIEVNGVSNEVYNKFLERR